MKKDFVIYDCLHQMGISLGMRGSLYIKESVLMLLDKPELLQALTKELYPAVAYAHATSPAAVEKAMRIVIKKHCSSPVNIAGFLSELLLSVYKKLNS